MKAGWVVLGLLLAGCTSNGSPDPHLAPGEEETWVGAVLDAPLVIERGAKLDATGVLVAPSPLIIRGELRARHLSLNLTGEEPVILVEGGNVTFNEVTTRNYVTLQLSQGARVVWANGTFPVTLVEVGPDSSLEFQAIALTPAEGHAARIVSAGGVVRIVNSSTDGVELRAEGEGVLRVVGAGAALERLGGSGVVERAWHLKVHTRTITGSPLPDRSVEVRSLADASFAHSATSGLDGTAYLEVVDLVVRNGQPEPKTPHQAAGQSAAAASVVFVYSQEQEVVLIEPG